MNFIKNTKCAYCLKKIQSKFIYCIQCKVEICVKCFCYGIEGGDHRKTHKYKIESIVKKDKVCLFKKDSKWNFDEELKLMDAVVIYKTGNWLDISSMVQTKTSDECRLHFIDYYTKSSFGRNLIKYLKLNDKPSVLKPIFDHTEGETSPIFFDKYANCLLKSEEEKLLGYISNRNEFHLEYNDSAEQLISTMEPVKEIDSLIAALQSTLVDIYDHKLMERDRYKHVAREHNLISHIIAHILDKNPRDYAYFHRQMLKRIYPSHHLLSFPTPTSTTNQRQQSLFGRVYMRQHRSMNNHHDSNHDISLTAGDDVNEDGDGESGGGDHPIPIAIPPPLPTPSLSSPCPNILSSFDGFSMAEDHPSWHYNAFSIDNHLRPFLKYLTAATTKQFLDSLKKEEQLKSEIVTLQACVKHGILSYEDYREKLAKHKKRLTGQSNHKPKCRTKRKRGKCRNFGFNRMLRQKRVQKYLISLANQDN